MSHISIERELVVGDLPEALRVATSLAREHHKRVCVTISREADGSIHVVIARCGDA